MNNIINFVKKEFFLLSILFLVFINPFFSGYKVAAFLFLFILFKLKYINILFDKNVFTLFLFTCSYELLSSLRIDYVNINMMLMLVKIFVPTLLYLVGKYISIFYRSYSVWIFLLFFLSFSFSLIPIISIFIQINENGFIEGTRSMYLIWDKDLEINATGMGAYLALNMASVGLVNIKRNNKLEKIITWGVIILAILSFYCVLRLGSRTQIVIAILSLLGTYVLNFNKQPLIKNVIIGLVVIGGGYFLVGNIDENSEILKFYADRMDNSESGLDTAGGRTERWIGSLESVLTDPFGWEFNRFGYSHNLWLDVARVGGVIPLFFLILFTISSIKLWIKSLKKMSVNIYLKSYVFMFFTGFLSLFSVEPVMDGMFLMFLMFCLFVGMLKGINVNVKI